MVRFFFCVFILLSTSAFAMEQSSPSDEPNCSDWIFRVSSEEYSAAFDRWRAYVERSQSFIEMAKKLDEGASTNFTRQQLKAARLVTNWYSALIHLGGLSPIEEIDPRLKIRAIQYSAKQLPESDSILAEATSLNFPAKAIDVSDLPEKVRDCYHWIQTSFESGLPNGGFQDYLKAIAELSQSGS